MPALLRQPLARGLMVSTALHLAVLGLLTPHTGLEEPQTLVINARLSAPPAVTPEPVPPMPAPQPPAPSAPQPVSPQPSAPAPQAAGAKSEPIPEAPAPAPPSVPAAAREAAVTPASTSPAPEASRATPAAPVEVPAPALPTPVDPTWYLARQVDRHPRALGEIRPNYPESARQRGIEGNVKLMAKIDDLGRVQEVEVVEATPPGVFDEAALAALRNARFQPALRQGRPVRFQAYMRVEFKLE